MGRTNIAFGYGMWPGIMGTEDSKAVKRHGQMKIRGNRVQIRQLSAFFVSADAERPRFRGEITKHVSVLSLLDTSPHNFCILS